MKLASTVPVPYFYYPGTTSTRRQRVRPTAKVRRTEPTLLEESDALARKQEIVCASILGLSLISTLALCLWQLAAA